VPSQHGGGFEHFEWKRKTDDFWYRANRSRLCNDTNFYSLPFAVDQTLLQSVHYTGHCLKSILPHIKLTQYSLRNRGFELTLPQYRNLLNENHLSCVICSKQSKICIHNYFHVFFYIQVCVCVCVCARARACVFHFIFASYYNHKCR
jgi:hypothetical protein